MEMQKCIVLYIHDKKKSIQLAKKQNAKFFEILNKRRAYW